MAPCKHLSQAWTNLKQLPDRRGGSERGIRGRPGSGRRAASHSPFLSSSSGSGERRRAWAHLLRSTDSGLLGLSDFLNPAGTEQTKLRRVSACTFLLSPPNLAERWFHLSPFTLKHSNMNMRNAISAKQAFLGENKEHWLPHSSPHHLWPAGLLAGSGLPLHNQILGPKPLVSGACVCLSNNRAKW